MTKQALIHTLISFMLKPTDMFTCWGESMIGLAFTMIRMRVGVPKVLCVVA